MSKDNKAEAVASGPAPFLRDPKTVVCDMRSIRVVWSYLTACVCVLYFACKTTKPQKQEFLSKAFPHIDSLLATYTLIDPSHPLGMSVECGDIRLLYLMLIT